MEPRKIREEQEADSDHPDPVYPDPPCVLSVTTKGDDVDDAKRIEVAVNYTHPNDLDSQKSTVVFKVRGTSASLYEVENAPTFGHRVLAAVTAEVAVRDHPFVNGVAGVEDLRSHAQMWIQDCERNNDENP